MFCSWYHCLYVYVLLVMKSPCRLCEKRLQCGAFGGAAVKMVLICVVVLAFMFRLAQYKGIPESLSGLQ